MGHKFEKFLGLILIFLAALFIIKFAILPSTSNRKSAKSPVVAKGGQVPALQETAKTNDPLALSLKKAINTQPELSLKLGDLKEISFISNLNNPDLDSQISEKLNGLFRINPTGNFMLEAELFDTASNLRVNKRQKSKPQGSIMLVIQFSVFDIKTMNKVAEFSVSTSNDNN